MGYSGALIAHQGADRLCTVTNAGSWDEYQAANGRVDTPSAGAECHSAGDPSQNVTMEGASQSPGVTKL